MPVRGRGSFNNPSQLILPCKEFSEVPIDSDTVPIVPASAQQQHKTT